MIENFTPIFSVTCTEGDETVVRSISPLIFTPNNVKIFFNKAKQYPVLFGKPITNEQQFIEHFVYMNRHDEPELNGMFWTDQDMTTVFYLTNLMPDEADAHYTFLDGRLKGREELVNTMLKFVFSSFGFLRLNASIPVYAKTALVFARKVGFTQEGRKRKCSYWKGSYFDQIQFGVLREEVLTV